MNDPNNPQKPSNWFEALNCAIEGIIYAFKTQKHIRYHYAIALVVLFLSLFFNLSLIEFVLFAIAVIMLLAAEMFNTAIEETVNLVEEKHHILAKNAKDISAGAVLISSMAVLLMSYVVFSRYIYGPATGVLISAERFALHISVISLLSVLIAVVAVKAYFGKGAPLHGGLPSGHAALSFSVWTCITLLSKEPYVSVLTFVLALMVSHSRLLKGIHTKFEIVMGAVLGAGLTFLIYYVFSLILKG